MLALLGRLDADMTECVCPKNVMCERVEGLLCNAKVGQ